MTAPPTAAPPLAIACVGAAHIDDRARAKGPIVLGTSNPVSVTRGVGGVARNVAEGLARLGCDVALVSRVGADPDGDRLIEDLARLGVDVAQVTRAAGRATGRYTALLDGRGDLVIALADTDIYEDMTPVLCAPAIAAMQARPIWFLDTNPPVELLSALLSAKPAGTIAAVDAVSVPKSAKLAGLLDRIDLLFVNRDELSALAGLGIRAPLDICTAAAKLRRAGTGAVVVGLGPEGAYLDGAGTAEFAPALPPAVVRNITGAGDQLVAGVLFGLALGRPLTGCIGLGLAGAALTVACDGVVDPELSAERLFALVEPR